MASKKILSPGDPIGYSEEFLPGPGTYDDGERLRAALFGEEDVDPQTMQMRVRPAGRGVPQVEKGDIVAGEVTFIKPDLASVRILGVRGKEDSVLHHTVEATLHASKAEVSYTKDLQDLYQPGDIIRAKVIGLRGGPQLATDKPDFGVLRARSADGNLMERRGGKLEDPETGRTERRKVAEDYGSGRV